MKKIALLLPFFFLLCCAKPVQEQESGSTSRIKFSAIADSADSGVNMLFATSPWNPEELKSTVRQCFDHFRLLEENRMLLQKVKEQNEQLMALNKKLGDSLSLSMRSLDIVQRILAMLPIPVIGISREGTVVLTNEAAHDLAPTVQPEIGLDIEDAVPANLKEPVIKAFEGERAEIELEDAPDLSVRIEPMQFDSEAIGALLVFQKKAEGGDVKKAEGGDVAVL